MIYLSLTQRVPVYQMRLFVVDSNLQTRTAVTLKRQDAFRGHDQGIFFQMILIKLNGKGGWLSFDVVQNEYV